MLAFGVILFSLSYRRGDFSNAIFAFIIGMAGGLAIDYFGVRVFRFWEYTRQPFLSVNYFCLIVTSWGVFAMTINLLWGWIADPILVVIFLFIGQMLVYEAINFKTKSWAYYAPMWLVFVGWFPLVLTFRAIFLASYIVI